MQQIEYLLQAVWPELDVYATSVTEQWTAAAISGPRARDVVAALVDIDVSQRGVSVPRRRHVPRRRLASPRACSASATPASSRTSCTCRPIADARMWEAIIERASRSDLMPYGTEAMSTLRIEKGHIVVGPEADGRTTADDLGLGKLVKRQEVVHRQADAVAARADRTPDAGSSSGCTALDGATMPRAAKIVADPDRAAPNPMQGHVTSWCYSPNLEAWIALALVADGRARHGETLWAVSPLADARVRVQVGPPCFIDPEGARLRV